MLQRVIEMSLKEQYFNGGDNFQWSFIIRDLFLSTGNWPSVKFCTQLDVLLNYVQRNMQHDFVKTVIKCSFFIQSLWATIKDGLVCNFLSQHFVCRSVSVHTTSTTLLLFVMFKYTSFVYAATNFLHISDVQVYMTTWVLLHTQNVHHNFTFLLI